MKRRLTEHSLLILSVVKWLALATIVGCLVGLSTSVFLGLLDRATRLSRLPFFVSLPLAFLLSSLLVEAFAPEARGHGTEKVIEAVHQRAGRINPLVVPVKLLASIITLAGGGSAGKEGPCAQIGGGIASSLASILRFPDRDRKKLVICGISAGFAAVFGTPIAGAIFGIEVLFVGGMLYDVLLPSFIAGICSYQVGHAAGIAYLHPGVLSPNVSAPLLVEGALCGLVFGLISILLIEGLRGVHQIAERIKLPAPAKALIGGAVLAILALVFSARYLGLGLDTIREALLGHQVPGGAFLGKILFTTVTLSFGGSGGIVTPIFFIGSTAGSAIAQFFHADPATFAALGLVAVLAGSANTPIAASIMAIEFFGPAFGPLAAVACVVSFLVSGHRSVYPSQILAFPKASSLTGEVGSDLSARPESAQKRVSGILALAEQYQWAGDERLPRVDDPRSDEPAIE